MTTPAILAIDGGGSGCRALLCDADGGELGRASGPFANLVTDFEKSRQHLTGLIDAVYNAAGRATADSVQDIAVLGIAGAEIGDSGRRLGQTLNFAMTKVLSDRDIAVTGILGDDDGTLAQIGTGSFFVHQRGNVARQVGGWGLDLGDEASGAWLGRELLRQTLHAHDGLSAASPLAAAIMARFNDDPDKIVMFASEALPGDYAALVPLLFDGYADQDPLARRVVGNGIKSLEHILVSLDADKTGNLLLTGGVGERYRQLLSERFQACLARPGGDALSGAILIGRRMLGRSA